MSRSLIRLMRPCRTSMTTRSAPGGLPPPPFARMPAPSGPVHEQYELIWNDSVAPELCIDFDAQHFTRMQGLAMWCGGLAFFASFYTLISCTEPPKLRKAEKRIDSLPDFSYELGLTDTKPLDWETPI